MGVVSTAASKNVATGTLFADSEYAAGGTELASCIPARTKTWLTLRQGKDKARRTIEMAKTLQASKIREIGEALTSAGLVTLDQQAEALGLCRSTTWAILQAEHKNSGLSATVINLMLASPRLPVPVRSRLMEYIEEKASGRYGHNPVQLRKFAERLASSMREIKSARVIGILRAHVSRSRRPQSSPRT